MKFKINMMDDERLLILVRERKELYNKSHPLYRFMDKKREAWMEIANELETTEDEVTRRWTIMRDRYNKERKKSELSGNKSTWPFFEMMEFIRPHATPRKPRLFYNQNNKIAAALKTNAPQRIPRVPTPQPVSTRNATASPPASTSNCEEFTQVFDDPLIDRLVLDNKTKGIYSDADKSFMEAVETLKKACAQNEVSHANPAVYAFGDMIISTICSMSSRNQIKTMQQVTDIVMKIKLEEDELLDHISFSTA